MSTPASPTPTTPASDAPCAPGRAVLSADEQNGISGTGGGSAGGLPACEPHAPTRIAIYDDLLSAPRIVDVEPKETTPYVEEIAATTYEHAKNAGGAIPYTVIKEVCENFIHADFAEPCVSILDGGNTIRFTDQGPGIPDKERAQLPGFTTATTEQRRYIKGVGSGLPTVREYLKFTNGRLSIEDNLRAGTVVTIALDSTHRLEPVVYREEAAPAPVQAPRAVSTSGGALSERDRDVMVLALELGEIGPTEINQSLSISLSTAYRILARLEGQGLLEMNARHKRTVTMRGRAALDEQL